MCRVRCGRCVVWVDVCMDYIFSYIVGVVTTYISPAVYFFFFSRTLFF